MQHIWPPNNAVFAPTAIGLIPPSLCSGISVAPKKTCLTDSGRSPRKIKLANSARAQSKSLPPRSAETDARSTRCCGRIPSGPPADPRGNDRIAPVITSSDITGRGCMSSGCGDLGCSTRNVELDAFPSAM